MRTLILRYRLRSQGATISRTWPRRTRPIMSLSRCSQSRTPPSGATGPTQLATYTVESSGMLATSSTRTNMPAVAVGNVNYLKMAPSGKLLAVAGSAGLQVFHFNGASPITKFTGQLTKTSIDQCFWDNANHLYAISDLGREAICVYGHNDQRQSGCRLAVFDR